MSDYYKKLPLGTERIDGYTADPTNTPINYLSSPSQNCLITNDGKVEQRRGYREEFSIGLENFAATAFYHSTYDIAFFALGTKVYYRDFVNNATYDTGITLTTGTTTRFDEIMGDVYLSNPTDGIFRIVCGRLNDAAATAGDGSVFVDVDFAARLSVFSIGATGSIVINGTSYAYNATDITTGEITLNAVTLSASYLNNNVIIRVHNISSGREKFSKIVFWKSRMHGMGFPSAANADQPNNSVMAGQFIIGQTGASGIELIIDFTYGTGGSTKIMVLGGGALTNILGAKDVFWFFTQNRVFATLASSISTDASGGSIGLTIPVEQDVLHGCLNEDCATVMGDSALTYITDKRIYAIPLATDSGAAVSPVQEDFDVDIRDELKNMDPDQTGAFSYHYKGGRQTIYQVKESGQWVWHIFDHNIERQYGNGVRKGIWQPPQKIVPVKNLFERKGVLYGTDISTDKVYSFFTNFNDNNAPINCIIATGEFNIKKALMGNAVLNGELNFSAEINISCYVWNKKRGKRSGSPKVIMGSSYNYSDNQSFGAVPVGDGGVTPVISIARWDIDFGIFPSEANRAQLVLENRQDGAWFSLTSFELTGKQYPSSFTKSI